jgi:uncharacterized protein HemX
MKLHVDTSSLSSKALSDCDDSSSSACSISVTNKEDVTTSCYTKSRETSGSSSRSKNAVFGKAASIAVNRSKLLVYLVLVMVASGFGAAVYFLLKDRQQHEFETEVRPVRLRSL